MTKAKKTGAKKDDAKKAGRLPKRIGGVKIPKELRRKGEALIDKANSPEGRQAIASGLAMVGALVAANAARKQAETKAMPDATKPEAAEPGRSGTNPQQLADSIGAAADMLLGRIFAKR